MSKSIQAKIENFFYKYKSQNFKKNKILINISETPSNIYFLEDGWVKMYSLNKNGEEIILNIFKPNSFFPISLAINNNENNYFYEAQTDIKARLAPANDVIKFLESNPDVLFDLLKRVYRGLDGVLLKMEYAMTNDAKSRLILELVIQAKRFGNKSGKEISFNISINDLALSVGIARETVSRELKLLKEKGLISFEKKTLRIANIQRLENEIF